MKKILAFLLVLVMTLSFAACNKQPAVESSSETVTTSEETITTTSEETVTTTSVATTTTSVKPSSSSKIPSTSVPTTTRPTTTRPTTTTSKPTYSGTYMEDTTIASSNYTYETLKSDLQAYINANEPTKTTGNTLTYDLTSNFKKYSILGYYAEKGSTMTATVTANASDKTIKTFTCSIKAAYKEPTFVEDALKRDYDKLKTFYGKAPTIYITPTQGGNPQNYDKLTELPTDRANKIYRATSSDIFNLKIEEGTSAVVQITVKTSQNSADYTKMFESIFKVDY